MTARTRWIVAIVGLLGGNIAAMVVLAATAAHGSSQVIPAYYDHATHYDDVIDRDAASHALGWHATATYTAGVLAIELRDAHGAVLHGARVVVTGYQRAHSNEPIAVALAEIDGVYRGSLDARPGVHDVVLVADRDHASYEQHLVLEVR